MRCLLLLVALGACSNTIAAQKPRAWFGEFDVEPRSEPLPHHAVLHCDHLGCRVDPPDEQHPHATGIATLTMPGRYPLRVRFSFGEGEHRDVELLAIEAVLPDDVAMRCITDDVNLTVEVSLMRGSEVIPGSPSIVPGSGICKPTGIAYDSHAAVFECPLQSPGLAQWVDAKITAPNISKRLNANCERRPRP